MPRLEKLNSVTSPPVDFDNPDSPWRLLAENSTRVAALQAHFGPGRVLTMRLKSTKRPEKVGNKATFKWDANSHASWEAFAGHVKLLVTFTGPPTEQVMTVDLTKAGVDLVPDGDGGLDVVAGEETLGSLPAPWIEYTPDGAEEKVREYLTWEIAGKGKQSISTALPDLSATEWASAVLDPTVITTSTASTATAFSNQRKIDRTSNGVLWAMFNIDNYAAFCHSTDDGATWSSPVGGLTYSGGGNTYAFNGSFFIDADDYAHVAFKDKNNGYIYYVRGTPNASRTAWTWSASVTVYSQSDADYPDIAAHREGTGWVAHVVWSRNGSSSYDRASYRQASITSTGVISLVGAGDTTLGGPYGNTTQKYVSIDFNHTGDGKTVAGGTPHLYVAWSAGATGSGKGIRFKKATYSGGAWTWGTEREIDSTRYHNGTYAWLNCLFDGTEAVIGGMLWDGSQPDITIYARNATDTATTTVAVEDGVSSGAGTALSYGAMSYDGSGDLYLFGVQSTTPARLAYRKVTRATGAVGAAVAVDTSNIDNAGTYVSAKRGYSGGKIEFIYTDGTASPYSVTYGSILLNDPPTKPSILSAQKSGGGVVNVNFDHIDPDNDPPSKHKFRWRRVIKA